MSQSREQKAAKFIEAIEKIHQLPNEKERQDALQEKRAEILEDIFPTSPITPEDNFCQMKDLRITKEGFIQPNHVLLDCIAKKKSPNGLHILTVKHIFQSDTLQKIQKAIQDLNQENLIQYARNNQLQNELAMLAKEIAVYEQQNAELAKEIAQLTSKPLKQSVLEESKSSVPSSGTPQEEKVARETPSPGTAFSVEDFFAFEEKEEKVDFHISDQGEIYQGPDLPKKDSKNPIIVTSYKSSDLNKIHYGYKTLQTETLFLQQKEKGLQQEIAPLKAAQDAVQKANKTLLDEVQLLREAKQKRKIAARKKKETKQKENKENRKKLAISAAAAAAQQVLDYLSLIEEMKKNTPQANEEKRVPAQMTYSYCRPILKAQQTESAMEQFVSAIRSGDLAQIRRDNLADITDTDQCYRILDALTDRYDHQHILNLLIDELGHSPQKLLFGMIQNFNHFCSISFSKLGYSNKLLSNLLEHPKMQAYLDSRYEYFFYNTATVTPHQFAKLCKCEVAATKVREAQTKNCLQKPSSGVQEGLNLFATLEQKSPASGFDFGAEHASSAKIAKNS